ncbi:MAG: pyridoxamine 5'-phosphate oxidase family protein [Alphaproteobacteria bacterium]|nr:pyridoxamine 5'-phosphate oxidase family protein [Alphaproteobacteria bacterium]
MEPSTDVNLALPWHVGERAVQARLGVFDRMTSVGRRSIRSFMPDQHRAFFEQLPFLIAGVVDDGGKPQASVMFGKPGFARSPDPQTLSIHPSWIDNTVVAALKPGASIALLGIELPTRRRNRMNGRVTAVDEAGFSVAVDQSFGNCVQYIQRRDYAGAADPCRPLPPVPFSALDAEAKALVGRADTFFVASAAQGENGGVDVSHRGGRPEFVGIAQDGAIVVPDFAGNRFFNTLGNLTVNPRAGLLFIDFEQGDLLQLSGTTEIIWEGPQVRAFRGAERVWRITVTSGNWIRRAWPMKLVFGEFAPTSLATGTWAETPVNNGQ